MSVRNLLRHADELPYDNATTALAAQTVQAALDELAGAANPAYVWADEVDADSPVAWLRLGESSGTTAADETGNGNTGTYVGSPALGADGAIADDADTAVTLDGVDDYITWDTIAGDLAGSDFTLEMWVRPTSNAGGTDGFAIFGLNTSAGGNRAQLRWSPDANPGHVRLDIPVGNQFLSSDSFDLNGWHHIVWTRDGSDHKVYVDGTLQIEATQALTIQATDLISIGQEWDSASASDFLPARVDEAVAYTTVLSAGRVEIHHEAGIGASGRPYGLAINVVTDFDATGRGSADDTTACQNALDEAGAAASVQDGRTCVVYFPAGVYQVDPLYIPDGVTVVGDGPSTVLRRKPTTTSNTDSIGILNVHGTSGDRAADVIVARMKLDGNKANVTVGGDTHDVECFSATYADDVHLIDVWAVDSSADGFDFDECDGCTLTRCHAADCNGYGIHFSVNSVDCHGYQCTASACGITNTRGGFDVYTSASDCSYVDCHADGCYAGFVLAGNRATVIGGTAVSSTVGDGLSASGDQAIITGLRARSNAGDGVSLSGDNSTVTGCALTGNTGDPLTDTGTGNKKSGNVTGVPDVVRKATDETVNNSNTYQDDDELTLPVAANRTYRVHATVFYESDTAADIKVRWSAPTGATMTWAPLGLHASATTVRYDWTAHAEDDAPNAGRGLGGAGTGVSNWVAMEIVGTLVTAGTAGDLTLQWAQLAAHASDTIVMAGSYLKLEEIG